MVLVVEAAEEAEEWRQSGGRARAEEAMNQLDIRWGRDSDESAPVEERLDGQRVHVL